MLPSCQQRLKVNVNAGKYVKKRVNEILTSAQNLNRCLRASNLCRLFAEIIYLYKKPANKNKPPTKFAIRSTRSLDCAKALKVYKAEFKFGR